MKHASTPRRLATAAVLAALCAGSAQAAFIFEGTYNNGNANAYMGTFVSNQRDSGHFDNGLLPMGAFTNIWVFSLSPSGQATMNANFVPGVPNPLSIGNFQVSLFAATAAGGCAGNTPNAPGLCTGLSLGGQVGSGMNLGNTSSIPFTPLTAGLYAMVITGTVLSTPTLYSGQLTTLPVPEPASLALVGLGLCGAALGLRRSQRRSGLTGTKAG